MASSFSRTTRALNADSGRMQLVALGVGVTLLAAWLAWMGLARVTVVEVSRQARLESTQRPRDIVAPQNGRLTLSGLQLGRRVRAGDILVELDAGAEGLRAEEEAGRLAAYPDKIAAVEREIAALEGALTAEQRSADAAVRAAHAHLSESRAAADFAADNAGRMRKGRDLGGVAEVEALKAESEAAKAAAVRDALSADARRAEMSARAQGGESLARVEDLRRTLLNLRSDMAASEATLARLRLEIENRRIRAPVSGVIGEAQPVHEGAFLEEGQKLATIVPAGGLVIVADFDPGTALGRLRPGQTARMRLAGFPWAQYGVVQATVVKVSSEIRDNALRVELTPVAATSQRALLRHGLKGVVEIGVEDVAPAALLLRAAGQAVAGAAPVGGDAAT